MSSGPTDSLFSFEENHPAYCFRKKEITALAYFLFVRLRFLQLNLCFMLGDMLSRLANRERGMGRNPQNSREHLNRLFASAMASEEEESRTRLQRSEALMRIVRSTQEPDSSLIQVRLIGHRFNNIRILINFS